MTVVHTPSQRRTRVLLVACVAGAGAWWLAAGCASPPPPGVEPTANAASSAPPAAAQDEPLPPVPSPYDVLPEAMREQLEPPFTGDLEAMLARRLIRAGVVFNRTQYFIDRGVQHGIAYESIRLFEEQLNLRAKTGRLQVHVAFVPLSREQLLPALLQGTVDLVAAAMTVTPERQKLVAFSDPTRLGVSEIVVTAAGVPALTGPADLADRDVFVRRSSSYFESLTQLNRELAVRGQPLVRIKEAPETLEDDDLLEMVNAGLVEATVVDDFVARFWQGVFPNLQLHADAAVRTDGTIAVAVRKDNPRLLRAINVWIKEYGPRTTFGNLVDKRYLENTTYARNATSEAEREKFDRLARLFQQYGDQYKLDYLLMAAQGYQESGLNHGARSAVGAIGVMQVMPATATDLRVGDVTELEPNIHAGIKYVRLMMDQYFASDPMDDLNKLLMTLASYNAGPARIRRLREATAARGLDPNVWFGNVERLASERIGRETVQYVGNIYKYYVAYRLALEQRERRERLRQKAGGRF